MTQFFLYGPDGIASDLLLACAKAATAAGECSSIVVEASTSAQTIAALQNLSLATLLRDCEPEHVLALKADGLHLTSTQALGAARATLKNENLGVLVCASRHAAMEAAEAGADYVAFGQTKQYAGEPIIGWWHDVTQIPSVAFDPVEPEQLEKLLAQEPDFIRPADAMWESAEAATRIISALGKGLPK